MPVVSVPNMLIDGPATNPKWSDVCVSSRKERDILRELALRFPLIERKLLGEDGEPRWVFGLAREHDGEFLLYHPDQLLDVDERLSLIPMVGC